MQVEGVDQVRRGGALGGRGSRDEGIGAPLEQLSRGGNAGLVVEGRNGDGVAHAGSNIF